MSSNRTSHIHVVASPAKFDLQAVPTRAPEGLTEDQAKQRLKKLRTELQELQELLWGAGANSVLLVLQGMDAGGKDGTIKSVLRHVNPVGVEVTNFKVPSELEQKHDYLWRIHQRVPARGMIGIFNRSHYEDVVVTRVKHLVPGAEWRARYDDLNQFEQMLTRQGTIVVKFFLHISRKEQRRRLIDREREPEKYWKLNLADWRDRSLWDEFQAAYSDAIGHCGTPEAPWYVIPADAKWYRDLAVAEALVERLRAYRDPWYARLETVGCEAKAELDAAREKLDGDLDRVGELPA